MQLIKENLAELFRGIEVELPAGLLVDLRTQRHD